MRTPLAPRVLLLVPFLLTLAPAGCGGVKPPVSGGGPSAAPLDAVAMDAGRSRTVELVFSHALEGQAGRALEDAVAAFDRSREDITVRVSREPRAGRNAGLEQSILSGGGPDVFLAGDMFAMDWIDQKHMLQPLDRLMISRGMNPRESIRPRYLARVTSGGLVYGIPLAISVPMLVVNPDVVKRGCDMAASPAANAGRPIGFDAADWTMVAAFLGAFDAALVDSTGMPAFDSEGAVRAVDFVRRNLASGGLKTSEERISVIDMFNSGAVNAALVWPDQVSLISADRPWLHMPMPSIEGAGRTTPLWQVDTLFISSWSRHYDASADLVAWLTAASGTDMLARDGFPGLFAGERDISEEYAAMPLSRGIRTQQAGGIPSPVFQSARIAADVFATTVAPLFEKTGVNTDTVKKALEDAATRARASVTKIRQGQSLILR